ncbi:hypothetical protein A2U01_0109156, partial [Trifolium medium]|nr:hypothetical protein [Trifolium medium]
FQFALEQMRIVFPEIDAAKLGEMDSTHTIVDGKLVPYTPSAAS